MMGSFRSYPPVGSGGEEEDRQGQPTDEAGRNVTLGSCPIYIEDKALLSKKEGRETMLDVPGGYR
jgi:hypothetical protein